MKALVLGSATLALAVTSAAQSMGAESAAKLLQKSTGFSQNKGQWDSRALFTGRAPGMDFWISKEGFVFQYFSNTTKKSGEKYAGHTVGMLFDGAQPFTAKGIAPHGSRQFLNRRSKEAFTTSLFERVLLSNVYKGVDVVTYYQGKTPRYDFIVKPGAVASSIRFSFKGTDSVKVVNSNKLEMKTVLGTRTQEGLFAYQDIKGKRVPVDVSFKQIDAGHVGFEVGQYDKTKNLVIDPLVYGTYYGGDTGFDEVRGVGADSRGNVYLTGYTKSPTYPVLFGPFGFNLSGGKDAFVSRLQGDAYNHDYSALIGGSDDDTGDFVQLDSFGNVWVLGTTNSLDFPDATGPSGAGSRWIVRFAPSASTVLDPTSGGIPQIYRFGGAVGAADINDITSFSVRRDANVVAGTPVRLLMTGNCTNNGLAEFPNVDNDGAFYMSLDYDETARTFTCDQSASGFVSVGGIVNEVRITGGCFDVSGNFYLNGTLDASGNTDTATDFASFLTTPGVFNNGRLIRNNDIFVRKMNRNGGLGWSAVLGGGSQDRTEGFLVRHDESAEVAGTTIAADPQGNTYVLGRSNSFDFPRTRGVFGEVFASGNNYITVTKISPDGSQILYSTNIRNGGTIHASGIAVDPRGNTYLTGQVGVVSQVNGTPPPDPLEPNGEVAVGSIPTFNPIRAAYTYPAFPEARTRDGWFMVLNEDATAQIRSTYVGGILDEGLFAPYVDTNGDVWVFGWVDTWRYYRVFSSTGTVTERIQNGRNGGLDAAFITNLAFKAAPEPGGGPGTENETDVYHFSGFGPVFIGDNHGPVRFNRDGFLLRFREAAPLISNFTVAPSPVPGGDPTNTGNSIPVTGTVTLSGPAPQGGARIELTLDSTAASFNATTAQSLTVLTIPAGATNGTVQLFGRAVTSPTNVNVRADYAGNVRQATLQVIPWLNSVTLSTTSVIGGNTAVGTIQIEAPAPAGGVLINLTTDRSDIISFVGGSVVTIPAGASTANFTVSTAGVTSNQVASINGTLMGVTRTASLGVTPARLDRVVINPSSIASGESTKGKVVLTGRAAEEMTLNVEVAGNPTGYSVTSPTGTITIPAGASESNEFDISTPFEASNINRTVVATRVDSLGNILDGPVSGSMTLISVTVDSLTLNPVQIQSGGLTTATLTLKTAAPTGGVDVLVSTSNMGLAVPVNALGVPIASVRVPEGQITTTFLVRGLFSLDPINTVDVIAYRGPVIRDTTFEVAATLEILPLGYTLSISPSEAPSGGTATGTLTLSAPAIADGFTIPVTCDDPTVSFGQPVFQTGQTSATFTINAPTVEVSRTLTFTAQAGTLPAVSASLLVRATEVTGLRILPSNRVRQNSTVTFEITLNRAAASTITGRLNFSNATLLQLPTGATSVNFTVNPGQSKVTVVLRTRRVPRTLSTTVTASVGSGANPASASATLFVVR
jgi:hypothetical protein